LQLGTSSVNSEPRPNSMSRNPYSQVLAPADTFELMLLTYDEVSEWVAEEMVDRVVKVAVVEEELLLLLPQELLLFPLLA